MALSSETVNGLLTLLGGFLIHLTLGTLYTFGNMNPYFTSYLRVHSQSHDILQTQSVWIFSLTIFGQGGFMLLGGVFERKLGPRLTALLGGWTMSGGVLLTAVAIKVNFALTVFTYGLMVGIGTGIAYAVVISAAMVWFPNHKGLVGGVVVGGFGGGALIFNQVQTLFINPHNVPANETVHNEKYFVEEDILKRVPSCFLLIGGIYAGLQLLGCILIRRPDANRITAYQALRKVDDEKECILHVNGEEPVNYEQVEVIDVNYHPFQMLRTVTFWSMWVSFLFNSQAIVFISTLYKTFGEIFIQSDIFLAVTGSLAAVMNAGCRIIWGKLHDQFGFRWLMVGLSGGLCFSLAILPQAEHVHKAFYLIWVCLLFGLLSGNFALFPAATVKHFGQEYMAINYGILFTANAVAGILGAFLASILSSSIGISGVFYLGAGSAFISMLSALFFRPPTSRLHNM